MVLSDWKERWNFLSLIGESKTFVLALLSFFVGIGFAWSISASTALFIGRVGVESLFGVYFGSALLSLGMAGLFYLWVDRFSRHRVFWWSFEILGIGVLVLWALLKSGPANPVFYYLARIYCYAVFVVTNLEFWVIAGLYFTNFEAKGRYPLLVAANVAGIMAGGILLDLGASRLGAVNFFLIWGLVLVLSPFLLIPLKKRAWKSPSRTQQSPRVYPKPPLIGRLLALLGLFWLAYTFLGYGIDFFFNKAALNAIGDENLLASYFGQVGFFSLLFVILFQIFVVPFLGPRLSVDRSIFWIALLFLAGTISLPFTLSLPTLTVAEGLFYYFVDFAAVAQLQPAVNLFPASMKGKVVIGVEGFGRPLGNLLLLVVAQGLLWMAELSFLSYVLLGGALLFLAYPFLFRQTYFAYLLEGLDSPERPLMLNAIQALGEPDKKQAAAPLLALLAHSGDVEVQREIILALGRMQSEAALPRVIAMFSVPNESLQLAVLESLSHYKNYESLFALYGLTRSQENVSFQVRMNATWLMTRLLGKEMLPLLRQTLEDPDLRIKANAIESIALLKDPATIPGLLPYLDHENRRIRANAAIALYPFRHTRSRALGVIEALFRSPQDLARFSGIYAIGELGLLEYKEELISLLANPDPRFGQQLLTALAKMGLGDYCAKFVDLLLDPEAGLALESIRHLSRFPTQARRKVFEAISRLPREKIERIPGRFDQTPLDFSKEKELLLSRSILPGPRPL